MQPKISVIVPVYKAEKYLHRCVDSILAQTFTDFELILVNDGSPDNCGAICDEYAQKDNRVRVFHKENGGVSSARNLGLDNAKGDIICFADSDDWVGKNFLELFNKKDADIVIQGFYLKTITDENNNSKEEYKAIEERDFNNIGDFLNTIQKADNLGFLVTKSFKREIINKNRLRLNCNYQFREDMEFLLRYLLECKTSASINKGEYHYELLASPHKYSHINQESNFLCTCSIIKSYSAITEIPDDLNKINIDSLSHSIFCMYKDTTLSINKITEYIKDFCKICNKFKNKKILSKKSQFTYYVIGEHTHVMLHRFYRRIISKIYK